MSPSPTDQADRWECPKCGEEVDASFDVCWQCGTTAQGEEDPDFLHADATQAIPDARQRLNEKIEHAPDPDFAGTPPLELVECYWARNDVEAKFLADRLIEQGIPAVADGGELGMGLSAAAGGSPRVRVRVEDVPRARAWLATYEVHRKSRTPTTD